MSNESVGVVLVSNFSSLGPDRFKEVRKIHPGDYNSECKTGMHDDNSVLLLPHRVIRKF